MISYLQGTIESYNAEGIVVDVNGVGFFVRMPMSGTMNIPAFGSKVKIHTHLYVKEDVMQLYGFFHRDELQLFEQLIRVNGIGPKGALGILSGMSASDLRFAILAGDAKTLSKNAPGVGIKTAQKLILELKDKISLEETFNQALAGQDKKDMEQPGEMNTTSKQEAILALTALGYPQAQALKAVSAVESAQEMCVEELLKAALKHM